MLRGKRQRGPPGRPGAGGGLGWFTTTSSLAAARPGPSWPTGCRRVAAPACCCAKPARTRRTATCRARSPTAIPASPISIRASTGPSCACAPASCRTTTRPRTRRRCASTSRRACSAAAHRSTASWPTAARRPTTTSGRRAAPAAGAGTTACPISRRSSVTSISTDPITARRARSRCAASCPRTGPVMRAPPPRRSWKTAIPTFPTRTASSPTATSRSRSRTSRNNGSRRRSAIWTRRCARART